MTALSSSNRRPTFFGGSMCRSVSQDVVSQDGGAPWSSTPSSPPPLPSRSASFVSTSSRRSGVVSEFDAIRLARALDADAARSRVPGPPGRDAAPGGRDSPVREYCPTPVAQRRVSTTADDHHRFQTTTASTSSLPPRQTTHVTSQTTQGAATGAPQGHDQQNVRYLPERIQRQQFADVRASITQTGSNHPPRQSTTSAFTPVSKADSRRVPFVPVAMPLPINATTSVPPQPAAHPRPTRLGSESSGASAVERLLTERDAELRSLRATMERNEQAILRALDDQRRGWETRTAEREAAWERRLRDAEERAAIRERNLMDRILRLEAEKTTTTSTRTPADWNDEPIVRTVSGCDYASRQEPGCRHVPAAPKPRHQQDDVRMCSSSVDNVDDGSSSGRSGPSGSSLSGRLFSLTAARDAGDDPGTVSSPGSASSSRSRPDDVHPCRPRDAAAAAVCSSCAAVRDELDRVRRDFEAEERRWTAEKERVVAYQKLLQVAYVELVRRCADLEERLQAAAVDGMADRMADCGIRRWESMPLERVTSIDAVTKTRAF